MGEGFGYCIFEDKPFDTTKVREINDTTSKPDNTGIYGSDVQSTYKYGGSLIIVVLFFIFI